jgi:hypothetical protein
MLDHIQKMVRLHVDDVIQLLHHLIDRHGADGHGRRVNDGLADGIDIFTGR